MITVYYPICLNLRGRLVVVVGGGRVAARKVQGLLPAGARVRVVSPRLSPLLAELAATGVLEWTARPYRDGDLAGSCLAFAVTSDSAVNRAVAGEARRRGTFCCLGDDPEAGDFIVPSSFRRGDVTVAVATGGRSPALAAHLRRRLEAVVGDEYAHWLEILVDLREEARRWLPDRAERERFLREVVQDDAYVDLVRAGQAPAARRRALEVLVAGAAASSAATVASPAPTASPAAAEGCR
ncbi:MAG: bifunctional precorrin-2 dehydrogenase/sirohydrochlorin ferrochelatase [Clostridia bacterium]|nr:bifunctional precorrin-2 dehydrogenase/sirohydrochlorin ferrochelatase [Clostridia bacterium]